MSALFEKPGRWLPYVLIVAVAGILVWRAESQNSAQDSHTRSFVTREVRRVESPCLQHGPTSRQCHESFGTALEALNEVLRPGEARIIVCRSHIFDQLDACKKVRRVEAAETGHEKPSGPTATAPSKEVMPSSPSTGHSQPGRHEGGSEGDGEAGRPPHHHHSSVPGESSGGEEGVSAPTAPPSSNPSQSSSSQTSGGSGGAVVEAPQTEAEPPVRTGLNEVLGGVGHTVEEAGHGVGETVHGVTCGVTGALGAPCE